MLNPVLEAVGLLIGMADPIDAWVSLDAWSDSLPGRLGAPSAVIERCVAAGLIEQQDRRECRRCATPVEDHQDEDHDLEPQPASVRVRPPALAQALVSSFAEATGSSMAAPLAYADYTYATRGRTPQAEDFQLVIHFGRDRASLPRTQGEPLIVLDTRGAPALPNPPAMQFPWVDLLGDESARERALAHVAVLGDDSLLPLQDLVEGLEHPNEPKDALDTLLQGAGYRDARADPGPFVDRARLTPFISKWYARGDTLLVSCGCQSRVGWHLHGFVRGHRASPLTIEPLLGPWVRGAAKSSRHYRELTAQTGRAEGAGPDVWKHLAGIGSLIGGVGTLRDDALPLPGDVVVPSELLRVASLGLVLLGVAVLLPIVLQMIAVLRLTLLGWPRRG